MLQNECLEPTYSDDPALMPEGDSHGPIGNTLLSPAHVENKKVRKTDSKKGQAGISLVAVKMVDPKLKVQYWLKIDVNASTQDAVAAVAGTQRLFDMEQRGTKGALIDWTKGFTAREDSAIFEHVGHNRIHMAQIGSQFYFD